MEIGAQVGRWVVGPVLGRGGMAVVHQVTHADLGTRAALKVLHTTDPRVRGRMLREGRAQARLEHPNIVRVHDVVEVEGRAGLLMEFVDGPDLSVWIRSDARPVPAVLDVIRAVAHALMAAHAANIVHRDLKPANVLLATGDVPKITDFGIAKILEDEGEEVRTRSGTAMGTPAYMPPEQIRSAGDIDTRADVYALGVVAYELLAGVRPYAATQDLVKAYTDAMSGSFVPLRERNPEVPESVEAAVHAALQGELDKRLPSVASFLDVFDGRADPPEPDGPTTYIAEDALLDEPSDLVARVGPVELVKGGPVRHTWRATGPSGRATGPSGPVLVRGLRADAATPKELDLAHREAEVLAQLSHPAIPQLIESFEGLHDGARWLFVVRQWVDGVSLSEEATRRRYSEEDVLAVLEEAAQILAYLHGLSPPVVHRDLRPSSFVRRTDGRLALVDFGHVRDAHPDTLGGHTIAGRFGFMAPEQFSGDASPATDAYGLGALAVALLGRKDPSELMDDAQGFRWRDTVKASAPVDTLLEGLLEPEPSDRVANAAEALRAVRRARKALLTHAERPSPMESLQEHLPPVPYQPMPPAVPGASGADGGPPQKSAVAAIVGSVAMVIVVGMALLAITTIVVVSKTSRPPDAPPRAPGPAASPAAPAIPFRYENPPPMTGPVRVSAEVEVTAQLASGHVELRNATEDLLVLEPLTVATVDGRPVALGGQGARAEMVAPGSYGRARIEFVDEALRDGVTFSVAPKAMRVTAGAPVVPTVKVARYFESEGLSCTANVRRRATGGEAVTGWSCDWTGDGWLIVDPPKATIGRGTTPVFRDSGVQAVPPGGAFELDGTGGLEVGMENPFEREYVIDLGAAVRHADVAPLALPELVFEARPLK